MANSENSYQSARKDALKAAAVVGTVAAASWGYRKFREHEDEIFETCLCLAWFIGILMMLPVLLPVYIRCKRNIEDRSRRDIQQWTAERMALGQRSEAIANRFSELPKLDQPAAHLAIKPIKEQIGALDHKIWRAAALWATMLNSRLKDLKSARNKALKNIEQYERSKISFLLADNQRGQDAIQCQLEDLKKNHSAEPFESFFDAYMEVFRGRLNAWAVLGFSILALGIMAAD
jgi:hypothetical protein